MSGRRRDNTAGAGAGTGADSGIGTNTSAEAHTNADAITSDDTAIKHTEQGKGKGKGKTTETPDSFQSTTDYQPARERAIDTWRDGGRRIDDDLTGIEDLMNERKND